MRVGELVELRWRDVAWTDQRLHVRRSFGPNGVQTTKGVHGRSVPMTPDVVALLDGSAGAGTRPSPMTCCR